MALADIFPTPNRLPSLPRLGLPRLGLPRLRRPRPAPSDRAALSALPDRMLADIGLHRGVGGLARPETRPRMGALGDEIRRLRL